MLLINKNISHMPIAELKNNPESESVWVQSVCKQNFSLCGKLVPATWWYLSEYFQLFRYQLDHIRNQHKGKLNCRVKQLLSILVRGNDISYRPLGFFPLNCGIKPILAKSCRRRKQVYSAWISQILREKCDSLVRERLLFTTMSYCLIKAAVDYVLQGISSVAILSVASRASRLVHSRTGQSSRKWRGSGAELSRVVLTMLDVLLTTNACTYYAS